MICAHKYICPKSKIYAQTCTHTHISTHEHPCIPAYLHTQTQNTQSGRERGGRERLAHAARQIQICAYLFVT